MSALQRLAELLKTKNSVDQEISVIVGRPALIGHVGEYIASQVFDIELYGSAAHKGSDGVFRSGRLAGKSVNVKWYAKREGLLDLNEASAPDYYLVFTGPKSASGSSRGETRPWVVESVFLFESRTLLDALGRRGVKIGTATSLSTDIWEGAEIYSKERSGLDDEQRTSLALFG